MTALAYECPAYCTDQRTPVRRSLVDHDHLMKGCPRQRPRVNGRSIPLAEVVRHFPRLSRPKADLMPVGA